MRLNLTSGSLFQGLGTIGTGAAVLMPEQKWIGVLIILVGVLALVFDAHFERGQFEVGTPKSLGKRLFGMWPELLMLVGIVCLLIGGAAYWHRLSQSASKPTVTLVTHKPNPLDGTILMECGTRALPSEVPASGVYWLLQLQAWRNGLFASGGIAQMTGVPGAKTNWPSWGPIDTVRCQITNYGPKPIFRVQVALILTYSEAIKEPNDPNVSRSGAVKGSVPWHIDISQIDVGEDKAFVFWAANLGPEFVRIETPSHITVLPLGEDRPIVAKLIPTSNRYSFVNPIREHQDVSAPTPTPAKLVAEAESPQWAQLDASEKVKLRDELRNHHPQSLALYCATPHCVDLGADLVGVFAQAGWQVTQHNGGGLGIDGLSGIRITSCNGTAKALKESIESTTKLKNIEAMDETPCSNTAIFIGMKPF